MYNVHFNIYVQEPGGELYSVHLPEPVEISGVEMSGSS